MAIERVKPAGHSAVVGYGGQIDTTKGQLVQAVTAIVTGVVHGVGFRYKTRERAQSLRLAGWVRNRSDGTVEIWAQGTTDALAEFSTFLERGPRFATVTSLSVEDVEPDATLDQFEIRL